MSTSAAGDRARPGRRDIGAEWVVDRLLLTFAFLLLSGGALGDRFGPGRVFVAGVMLFAVASAAAAPPPTLRSWWPPAWCRVPARPYWCLPHWR